jgi:hypothetical protein
VYANDFATIHNRSLAPVDMSDYTLQVSTGTSTFDWSVVTLSGTLQPGGYYLVKLGKGQGQDGAQLPTANATGTFDLPTYGGRIAIVEGSTPLTGAQHAVPLDLAYYGSTYEQGAGFSFGDNPDFTKGASRKDEGESGACQDTNSQTADFVSGAPLVLGNGTTAETCACLPPG